jgi:hypothetical protein
MPLISYEVPTYILAMLLFRESNESGTSYEVWNIISMSQFQYETVINAPV